jgi:hypothetical protein
MLPFGLGVVFGLLAVLVVREGQAAPLAAPLVEVTAAREATTTTTTGVAVAAQEDIPLRGAQAAMMAHPAQTVPAAAGAALVGSSAAAVLGYLALG